MTDRKICRSNRRRNSCWTNPARELDDTIVARLRFRARRCLATRRGRTDRTRAPSPPRWWLPVGSVALAGVTVAVVGVLWFGTPAGIPVNGFEDIELLASKESPDFYAELEFYHWLASRVDAT